MVRNSQSVDDQSDSTKLMHYERILELGAYAEDQKVKFEAAKEAAKDAKEQWEQSVFALQQAIKRANDPQGELEFGDDE